MRIGITVFLVLVGVLISLGQEFSSPVKHEIKLAGTFGELRSNHFHMGVDIKSSRGRHPDAILAADKGYISRIKVSRSGYGNALYIDHPSGYTTVYGHLKYFSPEIDAFVNKVQQDSQSFEIDFYADTFRILVDKGQEIGKMGNSGSSYGPHLHFEIRETISEAPLNPMLFGIRPLDKTNPILRKLKFHMLNENKEEINSKTLNLKSQGSGKYTLEDQRIGAWRIGISIDAYDPMNDYYNKNGIYKIELKVDGKLVYAVQFDSISFDDTKYINAHIDYPYFKQSRVRLHRCFKIPGNNLPNVFSSNDVIKLYKDKARKVNLSVSDFEGNTSSVEFDAFRDTLMLEAKPKIYNYILSHKEENLIQEDKIKIYFPSTSLYQDLYLYFNQSNSDYLSDVYHIGRSTTPVHDPITVTIKTDTIPENLRSKVCLVECTNSLRISTYGGFWTPNGFETKIFSFGNYALAVDTIPPTINALQKGSDFTKRSTMSFKIRDNFSNAGLANGLDYQSFIDGKWAKFTYDLKSNRLIHRFETPPTSSTHTLLLKVKDDRGNEQILEKKFTR